MVNSCSKTNHAKQSMVNSCSKTNHAKQSMVNNLKWSVFCGVKGFLTFNLAFLSYLEYSVHKYTLPDCVQKNEKKEENFSHQYKLLKDAAAFAMKRNTIPFLEMIIILSVICFGLPAVVSNINLMQCALICTVLMVATCFIVRTFSFRVRLLEYTTHYDKKQIKEEFSKDSIIYPIFAKGSMHIKYNSPNKEQFEVNHNSYLNTFLIFPLKILQSCILLALAAVEFLESMLNLFIDVLCDKSFESTKSNLQKSGHLLYASVRNLIPMSKFDMPITEFIGTPKSTCCNVEK